MSIDSQSSDNGLFENIIDSPASAHSQAHSLHVNPAYQPAFERVELTEIRAPFWCITNHAMHEYFDERR